jgi:hypothetical protein
MMYHTATSALSGTLCWAGSNAVECVTCCHVSAQDPKLAQSVPSLHDIQHLCPAGPPPARPPAAVAATQPPCSACPPSMLTSPATRMKTHSSMTPAASAVAARRCSSAAPRATHLPSLFASYLRPAVHWGADCCGPPRIVKSTAAAARTSSATRAMASPGHRIVSRWGGPSRSRATSTTPT